MPLGLHPTGFISIVLVDPISLSILLIPIISTEVVFIEIVFLEIQRAPKGRKFLKR
jgi:hypothetical protein